MSASAAADVGTIAGPLRCGCCCTTMTAAASLPSLLLLKLLSNSPICWVICCVALSVLSDVGAAAVNVAGASSIDTITNGFAFASCAIGVLDVGAVVFGLFGSCMLLVVVGLASGLKRLIKTDCDDGGTFFSGSSVGMALHRIVVISLRLSTFVGDDDDDGSSLSYVDGRLLLLAGFLVVKHSPLKQTRIHASIVRNR